MENPHLEVAVSSSKDIICQKRQAPTTLQEDTQPCKQVRKGSPVYSMEWEASSLPDEGKCGAVLSGEKSLLLLLKWLRTWVCISVM